MSESQATTLYNAINNKKIRLRWEESSVDGLTSKRKYRYYKSTKSSMYALALAIKTLLCRSREVVPPVVEVALRVSYFWRPLPDGEFTPEDWLAVGDLLGKESELIKNAKANNPFW